MAKDKTKSTEDLLLEITQNKTNKTIPSEEPDSTNIENNQPLTLFKEESSKEDLKDLTSETAIQETPLTETDYQILEQHCLGVDEKVICDKYNVSVGYLRKLYRNSYSNKFIEKWTNTTQQKVLTQSMGNLSTGMNLMTNKINKLIAEGKEDLALREMFGKFSLVEIHEKLAKLNGDTEEDTQTPMQNLFINLQQR